jgi:GDP-L-fucose synthase
MERDSRIFVAGHRGLIGGALLRRLRAEGYRALIRRERSALDLTDAAQVDRFFTVERPEYVFLAAGKVGGIEANRTAPAEFIHANLAMQTAVIHAAAMHGVRRLVFFGSACMYPLSCVQPMAEDALFTGVVEPTSDAYAVAKLAGLKMCEAYNRQYGTSFITVIPASVYGPNDHFDVRDAHVLAALLRKCHDAKVLGGTATVWGTGAPRREFVHADDVADACLFLVRAASPPSVVNVGAGEDISIHDLAERIRGLVGLAAPLAFDRSRPDGAPRKLLDSTRIRSLGWAPVTPLDVGLMRTYAWFREAIAREGQSAAPAESLR